MDSMVDPKTGQPVKVPNKVDDVYNQYGSAYFYQSKRDDYH